MPGTRCTASIVAVSFCEAHELARQDFEACLLSFPEIHARIKLLAEQRASKSKVASEDEKKARVRRVTSGTECVSDEGSEATFERTGTSIERTGTFRHAFKGSILKTLADQRLGASATCPVQPSGGSPAAAPEARASPCAQLRRELSQSCRRSLMSSCR